jgi:hypothetical protein
MQANIKTSAEDPFVFTQEEASEFNKRGLFIGGAAKSGTTLLMSLLDNHPQLIVVPEETTYLERRARFKREKSLQARLNFLLEGTAMKSLGAGRVESKRVGENACDYTKFDYQRFVALARDFINRPWMNDSLLFSETIRAYGITIGAEWRKCVRWVEKTPRTETHLDALDELFPDAKMIQMVRDPRAVFASRKKIVRYESGHSADAHLLVREWNRCARAIPQLQRDPARFLIVRYEDLAKNPKPVLETICRFGGFDFNEKMLEPTRGGSEWRGNSAFHKGFDGISTAAIDQWKDRLTQDEIWWVELHCRKGMALTNHPLQTGGHFSLSRWLKRLPDESWGGYFRARFTSLCELLGVLPDCCYDK